MKTKEVKTSIGTFVIAKPKAGPRNRALVKAETQNGSFKKTIFYLELLPKCIHTLPKQCDENVPIEHILDSLEIEEYDLLVEALDSLCEPEIDETGKKKQQLTDSSTTEDCQTEAEN